MGTARTWRTLCTVERDLHRFAVTGPGGRGVVGVTVSTVDDVEDEDEDDEDDEPDVGGGGPAAVTRPGVVAPEGSWIETV